MLIEKGRILAAAGYLELAEQLANLLENKPIHGQTVHWRDTLQQFPECPVDIHIGDTIVIAAKNEFIGHQKIQLQALLREFCPWRKGPYELFGIQIDTEWRSDFKWHRIQGKVQLSHKSVLDIGCANGYFGWRMLDAGAKFVLGVDPSPLYVSQFDLINRYISSEQHVVLPLGFEDVWHLLSVDMIFSLGVIYHRKDPHEHLQKIFQCLHAGGEVVIESLVVDDSYADLLQPEDRYAKMRNVWNVPSVSRFLKWIKDAGFVNVQLLDVSITSTEEQHNTDWIQSHSLIDFLDAADPQLTVEGYPRPMRAIILARKPG